MSPRSAERPAPSDYDLRPPTTSERSTSFIIKAKPMSSISSSVRTFERIPNLFNSSETNWNSF